MMRKTMAAALFAGLLYGGTATAQTLPISWDGGDGEWNDANWNGGQLISDPALTGRDDGSRGGHIITISGGANVAFDPNFDTGVDGDFGLRFDNGYTKFIVAGGATFNFNSNFSPEFTDGYWTPIDADLEVNGGTFSRTFSGDMVSGGALIFGSWNADGSDSANYDGPIEVTVKNGGRIENDGVMLFGYEDEYGPNVRVRMNMNDGHLDLTGGANEPLGDLFWENDLVMTSTAPGALNSDGVEANFSAYINMQGNGASSITVDEDGIANPHLRDDGIWENITTKITYEDLWNRDLLRANGMSGRSGRTFSNFFDVTGSSGSADYKVTKKVATQITWDGGDGKWTDFNWNGGQDISDPSLTGRDDGSRGGHEIIIGGGATVEFDPNFDTGIDGDLGMRFDNGYSKLTIKEGATVHFNSDFSPEFTDGYWTTLDSVTEIDGGTLKRTFSGDMVSGGALIFGSWNADHGAEVRTTITGGGRIENDGVFLVGYEDEMKPDVSVIIEIDNGHLDLTGGANEPLGDLFWENDLVITSHAEGALLSNGDESGFTGVINFTGSGSITVDEDGIANPHLRDDGIWENITTKITYEDLWMRGLLQANGLSGLDGEVFSDYFSIVGSSGSADYMLLRSVLLADFDKDGDVDGDDFLLWQAGFPLASGATQGDGDADGDGDVDGDDFLLWQSEFGSGTDGGGSSAVPEPSTVALLLAAAAGMLSIRRRS